MRRRACAFGFATVLVFLPYSLVMASSGCSDKQMPDVLGDPPRPDTGSGKIDTGPDVIKLGDAGPCDLLPLGGYVTQKDMTGTAPAATGGTIEDGFYVLTSAQVYGTGTPITFSQSLLIQNGTMHFTKLIKGESQYETLFAAYGPAPDGGSTSIALVFLDCDDAGTVADSGMGEVFPYSAAPGVFTLFGLKTFTIVDVFTKQ